MSNLTGIRQNRKVDGAIRSKLRYISVSDSPRKIVGAPEDQTRASVDEVKLMKGPPQGGVQLRTRHCEQETTVGRSRRRLFSNEASIWECKPCRPSEPVKQGPYGESRRSMILPWARVLDMAECDLFTGSSICFI